MAQLERSTRSYETSRTPREAQTPTSPTFGQFLHHETSSGFSTMSPTFSRTHDHEEDINHHNKKSVLTIVKEKAKKLRYSLSGKKKHGFELDHETGSEIHEEHDGNVTPSWGVTLEDEDDEEDVDPEYLGAPMYESEMAPESYKETARQHPRADPVVPENHSIDSLMENESVAMSNNTTQNKTITEAVSEKLAPAYAAMSGATHTIASKFADLTTSDPNAQALAGHVDGPTNLERCGEIREHPVNSQSPQSPRTWDKGVSVREYFKHNFEPGDDERALSQVITEAISPRRSANDMGVMGKMKEAMTSFLRPEDPALSTPLSTNPSSLNGLPPITTNASTLPLQDNYTTHTNSPAHIPVSYNANSSPLAPMPTPHEVVEEENHGRILQTN